MNQRKGISGNGWRILRRKERGCSNMKTPLKTLPFVFILAFLPSSLHAQQTTTVVRIVDGDTLKIRYWGKEESIRLIGIDTPESRVNKKAKRDAKEEWAGYKDDYGHG